MLPVPSTLPTMPMPCLMMRPARSSTTPLYCLAAILVLPSPVVSKVASVRAMTGDVGVLAQAVKMSVPAVRVMSFFHGNVLYLSLNILKC